MSILDEQGQPIRNFHIDAIQDRHIDELIGICRGVAADGIVTQPEAEYLARWIEEHRAYADRYPMNILYKRLSEMLADGILDAEESAELLDVIRGLTGEAKREEVPAPNTSTTLPIDIPEPDVVIEGRNFVFTGVFTVGTRKQCEEIVVERGGKMQKNVTKSTDYLVVGDVGSEHWVHSSYGRKIEKAVNYREIGIPISIVSENHWIKFI